VTATALPYEFQVDVAQEDIDFMGHVNNASYLKWVQAAVVSHWQNIAPVDVAAQHLWVALKHEITYRRPAFLDDDVVATVLLERVHGARASSAAPTCSPRSNRAGAASMPRRCARRGSPGT